MKAKFFAAVLAGMVTIALFGGLLYGVIFAKLFASNQGSATGVMKTPPDLLWVAIAHVPFGVLLTLVVLGGAKPRPEGVLSPVPFLAY